MGSEVIFKNKNFFLFISIVCFFSSVIHAGPIGCTRWEKGNQKVYIFFDTHTLGTPDECSAHFKYLQENIIKTPRTKPLLMLVENYMKEPQYRQLVQQIMYHGGFAQRYLQQFDSLVDQDFGTNVTITSIDARTIPFLTYPLFCEWQKRANGKSYLPNDIYNNLKVEFSSISFGQVFSLADQIQTYIDNAPSTQSKRVFQGQKNAMMTFINDAKKILIRIGGLTQEEINIRPIEDIWIAKRSNPQLAAAWNKLFIDYRGQDFWTIDLLFQLTNANILWEILHAPGDVAVFTGSYHAVPTEICLKDFGFKQTGIAKRPQVEYQRNAYENDGDDNDISLALLSYAAYDWMKEQNN
jgi:hypothetical protein